MAEMERGGPPIGREMPPSGSLEGERQARAGHRTVARLEADLLPLCPMRTVDSRGDELRPNDL